jgi:hypothetical protein
MEDCYKFNRAYYIRFKVIESDTYLSNYIFPNFARILEESGMDAIVVEEDVNGFDNVVLFLEDCKINEFILFCDDEHIIQDHYDISNELLSGDNLKPVIKKMMDSDEFSSKFNCFIEKNLTVDMVLDKISQFGKEGLTEIDKKILTNAI